MGGVDITLLGQVRSGRSTEKVFSYARYLLAFDIAVLVVLIELVFLDSFGIGLGDVSI